MENCVRPINGEVEKKGSTVFVSGTRAIQVNTSSNAYYALTSTGLFFDREFKKKLLNAQDNEEIKVSQDFWQVFKSIRSEVKFVGVDQEGLYVFDMDGTIKKVKIEIIESEEGTWYK